MSWISAWIVVAVTAAFIFEAAAAEPALKPGEIVITTVSGCRMITPTPRMKGVRLEKLKELLASDYETVRKCSQGELLHGPQFRVTRMFSNVHVSNEPTWFNQGRRFGYSEPSKDWPKFSINWDGVAASYAVGIDTVDAFVERVKHRQASAGYDNISIIVMDLNWMESGDAKRYQIIISKDGADRIVDCPQPQTAAACFPTWKQHSAPIIEKAKAYIAKNKAKVEALKASIGKK
jgi:hypothetical protein